MAVSNRTKGGAMPLKAKKKVKVSWNTTRAAILGAIVTVIELVAVPLLDDDPSTKPMYAVALSIIATGLGHFYARDNTKSSKDIGLE